MAKVIIKIEALNESCAVCPHLNVQKIQYSNRLLPELICANYNICARAVACNKDKEIFDGQ